jgi:murein L,D-transpeptidase YcbB/YkuD
MGIPDKRRQGVVQQHVSSSKTARTGELRSTVRRGVLFMLCGAMVAAAGCKGRGVDRGQSSAWAPSRGDAVLGVPVASVTSSIQAQLATRPATMTPSRWKYVQRLYTTYSNVPLWLEPDGFHEARSKALLRALLSANTDAIRLDAYPLDALVATLGAVRSTKTPTAEQLANADVLLTSTYVSLAEDLLTGQLDPRSLEQDWHIAANREAIDSAVARSLRDARLDSAIARMRPRDVDYEPLRRELVRFRALVDSGGWGPVPTGKALKPGQRDNPARLAALRARLRIEGFGDASAALPTGTVAGVYDEGLAGLVAEFQRRHGIVVDSVLGAETVTSLNLPADYRLAQIAANLERYRWLPRSFGERYIVVNVPAFRLEAHDTTGTLEMKVIVGKEFEGRKTPVFADSMETVVFRPYWNITPDIQAAETEPKIAEDPGYMEANDLEYFKDGNDTRIRQKPGPKNSLGLVKFLFPNSFNIYLHDTPEKELFTQDVRGFSHGCIRLEKPAELAQWVLGWDAARVNAAMHEGEDNQSTKLPRKIPVYIVYATVFERDGQLNFGNDVYNRDDAMVKAVAGSVTPSPDALRLLGALRALVED